ncbi:MAG: ECF-type sigma factor [Planctomycetota bacterium]
MAEPPAGMVTQVLKAASAGDVQAAAELLPLVYTELRKLAQVRMAKVPPGNTLQPTALVHEAYLRLIGDDPPSWNSRGHFFGAAAEAMRQILVEQARRKQRLKHGGDRKRVALEEAEPAIEPPADDILALNEALGRLEQDDQRKARIAKLRYFAGLTNAETAAALGVSEVTIRRECRFIRALLSIQLEDRASES